MSNNDRRSVVDHSVDRYRRNEHYQRQVLIHDLIERCSRALAQGHRDGYQAVAETLRDELIPVLSRHVDTRLSEYNSELSDTDGWDWVAFTRFLDEADDIVDELAADPDRATRSLAVDTQGFAGVDSETRAVVQRTLQSIVAICEAENVVMENYRDRVDAVGFSVKLGQQLKRGDMDFGNPVRAKTRSQGSLKSFYAGKTGSGKSVAAARDFEDYYRAQFEGGRRYKCLDYVGLGKAENICHDVPQGQDDLRKARERDHELPPGFDEMDDFDPNLEVLVPLNARLNDVEVPFDEDTGEFLTTPFTIPASDLSEGLVSALITSQLSESREQTIRDAYQVVDEAHDDWSLADLADEIRERGELSEKHMKDSLRVLRVLQNSGFIRTHDDDRALDWDEIMRSTERITTFSQSLLLSDFEQLMVVAYLIDKHWSLRKQINDYPPSAVWIRELWEIAQHQRQRSSRPDREKAVIEFIIDRLIKMMRKPRDIATHFLADTQEPNDVEKAVRRRFNRYVIFNSNHDLVESIMGWEGQDKSAKYDFLGTMSKHPGRGGIIGGCEPALSADRWGVSPVQFAPPSWHHHDKQNEGSGWTARPNYVDSEVLRAPDWDVSIPEHLEVSTELPDVEEAAEARKSEEERFREEIREEARHLAQQGVKYADIAEQIPDNPGTGKNFTEQAISNWVKES